MSNGITYTIIYYEYQLKYHLRYCSKYLIVLFIHMGYLFKNKTHFIVVDFVFLR